MSWRARAVDLLLRAVTLRADGSVERFRERVAATRTTSPEPGRRSHRGVTITLATIAGMRVYKISPPVVGPFGPVVYLHGGAYTFEISRFHWTFLRRLALDVPAVVYVPIYPLAPGSTAAETVPASASVVATIAADLGPVTLAGDSAGAGLALAVAQHNPSGVKRLVLISPWLDAAADDPRQVPIERKDHMLFQQSLGEAGRMYAGELGIDDPRVSPLFGPFDGLPPMDVFTGTHDILNVDAHRLAECVDVTLHEVERMQHVYPLLPFLAEARAAQRTIVLLCRESSSRA